MRDNKRIRREGIMKDGGARPYTRQDARRAGGGSDVVITSSPVNRRLNHAIACISALSPVVKPANLDHKTPQQSDRNVQHIRSPMDAFGVDQSFGNDSLLNESLFCALDDLEKANLGVEDKPKKTVGKNDSFINVFEDSFDDRQLLDVPDHSTPKSSRLERSLSVAKNGARIVRKEVHPVKSVKEVDAKMVATTSVAANDKAKKKTAPKKKAKRKGRFKVAYTNRKNIQLLSESGGNELSREELSGLADEDKLLITSWGLPESIVTKYRFKGVTSLFPWQLDCLSNPKVFEGRNLLYSAPTSAGKTLVAEMLMLKRVLELGKKGIMILPFVSVAREKMYSLQELFVDAGVRVEGFMGSYNPPGGFKAVDIAICTIEKANSLINRLLTEGTLHQVGTIVVDELHLVGDPHRGYLLELLLTKIKFMCGRQMQPVIKPAGSDESPKNTTVNIQIIGMSATLPNLHLLAKWLDAELHTTDYRPVPLIEAVKIGDKIYNSSLVEVRNVVLDSLPVTFQSDPDNVIYLTLETVLDGHSVLIFCPTKAWCEKLAEQIAREFFNIGKPNSDQSPEVGRRLREQLNSSRIAEVLQQLNRCPAGKDVVLGNTAAFGVAFHHAGLTYDERDILESAFKRGALRVIVATSTLSAGVNLPARRVIISSPVFNGQPLDPLTYKQMSGRAGRKGVDTEGESILICSTQNHDVGMKLIQSSLPLVRSALMGHAGALTSSMKRALLEVVTSGIARSAEDVHKYTKSTLLSVNDDNCDEPTASQEEGRSVIEDCLEFLADNELIKLVKYEDPEKQDEYVATQLGLACLASSLSPDEGIAVFKELLRARQCFVLANELHVIYQVTPLYLSDQWRNVDWNHYLKLFSSLNPEEMRVAQLVGVEERFIMNALMCTVSWKNPTQRAKLSIHQRFYAALALNDLVNEMSISSVAYKYGVNKGVIQNLQQSASTFAGMVTTFCAKLGWSNLELLLSQFQDRLEFGVQRELCDLVRMSSLNGQRARILYNAGIQTILELAACDPVQVEQAFLRAGPFSSNVHGEQYGAGKIFIQGRTEGVSEEEAARIIVQEARQFLQAELGLGKLEFGLSSKPAASSLSIEPGVLEPLDPQSNEATMVNQGVLLSQNTSPTSPDGRKEPRGSNDERSPGVESMELSHGSLNEASCPLGQAPSPAGDGTKKEGDRRNNGMASPAMENSKIELESENEDADGDELFENSEPLLDIRDEENNIADIPPAPKEKPETARDMFEIGPTQDVEKDISLMDMSLGSFHLSENGEDNMLVGNKADTMAVGSQPLFESASSSEDVFENSDNSPYGSLAETRIDIQQMLQKAKERSQALDKSHCSSSSDLFEDDGDDRETEEGTPSRFHMLHSKGRYVRVQTVNKLPDSLPSDFFKTGQPVSFAFTVKVPSGRSRPRFRIGAKVLGHQVKREAKSEASFLQYSLALYDGQDTVFLYESKSPTAGSLSLDLKSRVTAIFKKIMEVSCPCILLDVKSKMKSLVKHCGVDLLDGSCGGHGIFPPLEEIWDPKIAEWLCRGSEDQQFEEEDAWITTSKLIDMYLDEEEKQVQNISWPPEAKEAFMSWAFMDKLKGKVESLLLWNHFREIEMASFLPIMLMEINGFAFNASEFERLKTILKFHSAVLELKAFHSVDRHFNFASPKDIQRILFTDLKLKRPANTRGTGKDVLLKLDHEVAKIIHEWRQVSHALQQILPFSQAQNPKTGRIHGTYSHFTITGRLIMAEPSIQFIQRNFDLSISFSRAEVETLRLECAKFGSKVSPLLSTVAEGLRLEAENTFSLDCVKSISMRNAFCTVSSDFYLVAADYSQLELRVLAILCKDVHLCQTLNSGKDVFKSIASEWKKIPMDQVNTQLRQEAKSIVYAIIYGMGAKSLGEKMGIDEPKAVVYIEQFMATYPGIRTFINSTVRSCKERGYVETLLGRRRFLPHINSTEGAVKGQAERQAVNYKVQGSATELVKKAMIRANMRISAFIKSLESASFSPPCGTSSRMPSRNKNNFAKANPSACNLVLNMHDELIFEVRKDVLNQVVAIIRDVMENPFSLSVKLPVNIKVGRTWGSLKTMEIGQQLCL